MTLQQTLVSHDHQQVVGSVEVAETFVAVGETPRQV